MTLPKFNASQPLGLPEGSIRGLLAIIFAAAAAIMFVLQIPITEAQLVLTTGVVTYYFAKRDKEADAPAPVYIPPAA